MFAQPTTDQFKAQFPADFPYAVPGFGALGTVSIAGGGVTGVTVNSGGIGYISPPAVAFTSLPGDPGAGAAGTAVIKAGSVVSVTVTNPGAGYVNPPTVAFNCVDGDPTDVARVRDSDLTLAFVKSAAKVPNGVWPDQATYAAAFLLASAHFLVLALQTRFQGARGQGGDWLRVAKSVGDVSETYDFPERIKRSIVHAPFMKTAYGCQYLELLAPYLVGGVFVAPACARP